MAEAPHRGLPDEIAIWEILVHLPPKSLLRCRAVCRAWRSATSAHDFLLAHHARQPALPLFYAYINVNGLSLDVIPFDHRPGLAAAEQLQSVARLGVGPAFVTLLASCDGLLVLSTDFDHFSICNPATCQYASLPLLYGFMLLGMCPHSSTGEYRLLLYMAYDKLVPNAKGDTYILAIGFGQQPRHIGCPNGENLMHSPEFVLLRGSLHWYTRNRIMVFDTITETFRHMCSPILLDRDHGPGNVQLFDMCDILCISGLNDERTSVDMWVMQDYEGEAWAFKYRVELLIAEIRQQCKSFQDNGHVMVVPGDCELLVLVQLYEWLFQVDVDGKLVASFHRSGLGSTQLRLKQTLVVHTFFPTLEGYVANAWPFI